jgi:hypothetical protein
MKRWVLFSAKLPNFSRNSDRQVSRFLVGKHLAANLSIDPRCGHVKDLDDAKRLANFGVMTRMKSNSIARRAIHAHNVAVESKWAVVARNHA